MVLGGELGHVVVGVLVNGQREVLVAKRGRHLHQGGLWEFPGGKVEENEMPREALVRELREEVGVSVIDAEPFLQIHHDYGDKQVFLDVWLATRFSGDAHGREGQPVRWVDLDKLKSYSFPQANAAIIKKLLTLLTINN